MSSDDYVAPPEVMSSFRDCNVNSKALWSWIISMDATLEKHEKRIKELERMVKDDRERESSV